jgi:hypothetical protein
MNRRLVLHPGHVESSTDSQLHYLDAPTLARLYGIPLQQCVVLDGHRPETFVGFQQEPGDVHLYPRRDGRYEVPRAQ